MCEHGTSRAQTRLGGGAPADHVLVAAADVRGEHLEDDLYGGGERESEHAPCEPKSAQTYAVVALAEARVELARSKLELGVVDVLDLDLACVCVHE